MRAVRLHGDGLRVEEIETPSPQAGELLVRVHAAAITRGELEWPVDRLPAIPSYELSGVVADTGEEVYALTLGARDGVAAEYAAVPAEVLAPKPVRLSHVEAAALPMGGLTAWQGLFVHGRLARGERVLVTGAEGGVGHIAVQLARHAGAVVVDGGSVDLVFDTRGGDVPADVLAPKPLRLSHLEAAALPMGGLSAWQGLFVHGRLARGERVLVTGASGGVGHIAVQLARHAGAAVVESGPVDLVFDTRGGEVPAGERVVTIAEEMPGAIYFVVEPDHNQLLELGTLVDAGELRAEVDTVFPLTEARAAFERLAGRGKRGKVVFEVGTD